MITTILSMHNNYNHQNSRMSLLYARDPCNIVLIIHGNESINTIYVYGLLVLLVLLFTLFLVGVGGRDWLVTTELIIYVSNHILIHVNLLYVRDPYNIVFIFMIIHGDWMISRT